MWIQISSGRGPDECCLAVSLFVKYLAKRFAENGLKFLVLDECEGQVKGTFKSVLVSVEDSDCSGWLMEGSVKWVCQSPYRLNHRRKNWFIDLFVYDEPEVYTFRVEDVKVETMRASGPGGQHVNTTDSAVRVTHRPSGFTAMAREERSQRMNKKLALVRLERMFREQNDLHKKSSKKELWDQHNSLERGNPVMTFKGIKFSLS